MGKIVSSHVSWWESVFWWAVTLITLILLDDLITGPVFWLLAQFSAWLATILAFVASLTFQVWLTKVGMSERRGRISEFFLSKLNLSRKNEQIGRREESLKRQAASTFGAVAISFVVGGVLPILLLYKSGEDAHRLTRLMWVTATCYAIEFSLIHGGFGIGALIGGLV